MRALRILIATHSPLSPNFGAGQMAINLADAFRAQGHDVTLWSPYPMPDTTRWWQSFQRVSLMRTKLDDFLRKQQYFNIIDCPSIFVTKQVRKSTTVVARSVQPDILYMISDLANPRKIKNVVILPLSCLFTLLKIFLVLQGWKRANFILCLGSLELKYMKIWYPWWRSKLISYNNALSQTEQAELAQVRLNRSRREEKEGLRFLWIGRWVAHKGIKELVNFVVQRADSNPQDIFTIAGCSMLAEKDFPVKLTQGGKVRILPFFDRNELSSLLAEHDVGLFTSRVEGWGLVLNEMLESGMYVSATQAGGVMDLKPFFKDTLKPFPLASQSVPRELIKPAAHMHEYYGVFSWERIADKYINSVVSQLV